MLKNNLLKGSGILLQWDTMYLYLKFLQKEQTRTGFDHPPHASDKTSKYCSNGADKKIASKYIDLRGAIRTTPEFTYKEYKE